MNRRPSAFLALAFHSKNLKLEYVRERRFASYPVNASDAGLRPGKEVIAMATRKIGRNAGNGQFTTVKIAKNKPATHIVETIKTPKR